MRRVLFLGMLIAATFTAGNRPASAAFDIFVKIDGIDGESTDDKHKGWIEAATFTQGLSQPAGGSHSTGGAGSAERVSFAPFSIVKRLDKSSPKLALTCAKGQHVREVLIELCRAAGDKQRYMQYKLTDVIITSVKNGGSAQGGESIPMEELSFNFGAIEWRYTQTDPRTGKAAADVVASWNVMTNSGRDATEEPGKAVEPVEGTDKQE